MAEERDDRPETRPLTEAELAARRRRNVWLALALAGFVVLVGLITVIRLGSGIPERM